MSRSYPYQPIIIIGAARSGTKLLRDFIAVHAEVDRVPYDINYVWRMGNESMPHDQLAVESLTPELRQRIIRHISSFHRGADFLVEKTVSNCLRVPFVRAIFPEACFLHLVRDGRDVVESAYRQWLSRPNLAYIIGKARTFPIKDAFGYARTYAVNSVRKLLRPEGRAASSWGPRYPGIDHDVATRELLEVCAIQWARSVQTALIDLDVITHEKRLTIRYEAFVQDPSAHLEEIAEFVGLDSISAGYQPDPGTISRENIGKGARRLSPEQLSLISPWIEPVMSLLDYS